MTAEIVTLLESNFRDPVATLRVIADEIEAGKYGEVGCVGIALFGDTLEVFGAGADSDAASVGMVLHAAFMKLSRGLVGLGE